MTDLNCYSSLVLDPQTMELLRQFGVNPANVDSLIFSAVVVTVLTLAAVFPTVIIAQRRGRSRTFWLLFALSIPVLPLLLVWLLPAVSSERSTKP